MSFDDNSNDDTRRKRPTYVRDILKYSAHVLDTTFLAKQQVLDVFEPAVNEMIPAAGVAIKRGRSLEELLAIGPASLAFERVVSVGCRVQSQLKEFA